MPTKLTDAEIAAALARPELEGWDRADDSLVREFTLRDFAGAMAFMNSLVPVAEELNHHPTWTNTYNRVRIELTTHDADGLTDLDLQFAEAANRLAASA